MRKPSVLVFAVLAISVNQQVSAEELALTRPSEVFAVDSRTGERIEAREFDIPSDKIPSGSLGIGFDGSVWIGVYAPFLPAGTVKTYMSRIVPGRGVNPKRLMSFSFLGCAEGVKGTVGWFTPSNDGVCVDWSRVGTIEIDGHFDFETHVPWDLKTTFVLIYRNIPVFHKG